MHFEGRETVNAPIDAVWAFLTDAQSVMGCTPGFREVEAIIGPDHFRPVVTASVGLVKATFTLDCHIVNKQPPHKARITGRGSAVGSAVDAQSDLELISESPGKTTIIWTADATLSGALTNMGARLVDSAAEKTTNSFFACVREKLDAGARAGVVR